MFKETFFLYLALLTSISAHPVEKALTQSLIAPLSVSENVPENLVSELSDARSISIRDVNNVLAEPEPEAEDELLKPAESAYHCGGCGGGGHHHHGHHGHHHGGWHHG